MGNFDLKKYLVENNLIKESEDFEETLYYINDYWRTDGEDYDNKEEFIEDMKDNPETWGININLLSDKFFNIKQIQRNGKNETE